MRCTQLTLSNFGNHSFRVFDFTGGLIGIIGPNGSGKSHILGGISYALTGTNPNAGVKLDNIYDQAPATATSYVQLKCEHGPTRFVVTRNIRPARPTATMVINDSETITGDTEVTARIEQILGVNSDVINDIVIVAQADIFGFLNKLPAKRAEQFQKLFQTERAAVLYKVINDHLRSVEIPTLGADPDILRHTVQQQTAEHAQVLDALSKCRSHEVIQQTRDQYVTLLQNWGRRSKLEQSLQQLQTNCEQNLLTIKQHEQLLQQHAQQRQELQSSLAAVESSAEEARVQLAMLSERQQQKVAYDRLATRVTATQQGVESFRQQAPVVPVNYMADLTPVRRAYAEHSANLQHKQRFVASFANGVAECPTCHTPSTSLAPELAIAKASIPDLESQVASAASLITACEQYDRAVSTYRSLLSSNETQLAALQRDLQALPAPEPVAVDPAALQQVLTNKETLAKGLRECEQTIERVRTAVATYRGQWQAMQVQVLQLQTELSQLPIYDENTISQAQLAFNGLSSEAAYLRNLEANELTIRTRLTELHNQLQQCESVAVVAAKRRDWCAFAGRVRDLFHKDAAPRFVAQRNLEQLQTTINDVLAMFDTNFRVTADEGLSFQAQFVNGSRQPAERLSGGQKVILALAFRLALNLMFAENLGALYLDEPTSWLDEHHIRGFEPVLQRLRDYAATRGLQSIIVTHERGLAHLFDMVISL